MPADLRGALDSLARLSVRAVRHSGTVGIDIVFVFDTLSVIRGAKLSTWRMYSDYVLPRRAEDRCVVISHVRSAVSRRDFSRLLRYEPERLAGPCSFYRAFGMPGRQVDEWLRDRGWPLASSGSWTRGAPRIDLGYEMGWKSPESKRAAASSTWFFLREMSVKGVRCAAGALDDCAQAVQARSRRNPPKIRDGNVLVGAWYALEWVRDYYSGARVLGRRESRMMADMVRTLGRDRFARFWSSDAPMPVAFEQAAGESLGAWTQRWAVAQYGDVPPRGAMPDLSSTALSVGLILLALFIATRISARRQFA